MPGPFLFVLCMIFSVAWVIVFDDKTSLSRTKWGFGITAVLSLLWLSFGLNIDVKDTKVKSTRECDIQQLYKNLAHHELVQGIYDNGKFTPLSELGIAYVPEAGEFDVHVTVYENYAYGINFLEKTVYELRPIPEITIEIPEKEKENVH